MSVTIPSNSNTYLFREADELPSFCELSECKSIIRLKRPRSVNLVKKYTDCSYYDQLDEFLSKIQNSHVVNSIRRKQNLIVWEWSPPNEVAGKCLDPLVPRVLSQILDKELNGDGSRENNNVCISITILAIEGNATEKVYDCLNKQSSCMKSLNRIRESRVRNLKYSSFFMEGQTEILVENREEASIVLKFAEESMSKLDQSSRFHFLYAFKIYSINAEAGDLSEHCIKLVKFSPNIRSPKARGNTRNVSKYKEDKSLKAFNRVIDHLSHARSHIPIRDSKLTRLISEFGKHSENVAIILLPRKSSESVLSYDETVATIKFSKQLRDIPCPLQNDLEILTFNRKRRVAELTKIIDQLMGSLDLVAPSSSLSSKSIELDMNSPLEMVDLREALVERESLVVDQLENLRNETLCWWQSMKRSSADLDE